MYPGAPEPDHDSAEYKATEGNRGRWYVEDGCIVGGRQPIDSPHGSYLLTDGVYGDFELTYDMNPDWPTDTGLLVRATAVGSQGFQIHYDYRPQGSIATIYGNGIGGFRARQYAFDMHSDAGGRHLNLKLLDLEEMRRMGVETAGESSALTYAGDPRDVFRAIRMDDWNSIRVRVAGTKPVITTWLNGVKVVEFDAARFTAKNYDADRSAALLGPRGHIALEVHNDLPRNSAVGGIPRWGRGCVSRWKNLVLTPI